MRTTTFLFMCAVWLWHISQPAHSEELAVLDLDTLVVSESLPVSYAGETDLDRSSIFFSTVRREDFDAGSTGVADAIQSITGVQVRQTGGIGSYSTASLRGASADQVLVYVDGMLLNSAGSTDVDLSSISLADIDAIEIYRGITPFEFSAASIGGAINLRTRNLQQDETTQLSAAVGAFGTNRLSGLWSDRAGDVDLLLSADRLVSNNDFPFTNDNGTRYNREDDRREHRRNADLQQSSLFLKSGWLDDSGHRLDLQLNWLNKEQGLPSWNNSAATTTRFATDKGSGQLQFQTSPAGAYASRWSTRLSFLNEQETYDDRNSQIGLGAQYNRYQTRALGLDVINKHRLGDHELALQLNSKRESWRDRDLLGYFDTLTYRRDGLGLGMQDTLHPQNQNWLIAASARIQKRQDTDRQTDTQIRHQYLTGQAGVKTGIQQKWQFQANAGRYVREPSFFELYGDRGLFIGNSELRAERSDNLDLGIKLRDPRYPLLDRALNLELSLFHNRLQDAIVMVYDSRGVGRALNVSRARISGLESSLRLEMPAGLSASANYTHQVTVNEGDQAYAHGNQLPGRYTDALGLRMDWHYHAVNIYLAWQHESGTYYDIANLLPAARQDTVNTGISVRIDRLLASLAINNLADQRYEDFNGYPRPGRSWLFTLNYAFGQ